MPSVSPFEGGICCISKSDHNNPSGSSPSGSSSISAVVSSAWPSPNEEVEDSSNNQHQSSAVHQDSTGEEDSDYFASMCCDELLTYTAVSVVQPHHRPSMMMMTTMMPSNGVLGDGLMSSASSHHQSAAVADYMAQQLLPIGTASAAVQLHQQQQQQQHNSGSTATKTIPLFLDDPLCDGDEQTSVGLEENQQIGPIKNEITDDHQGTSCNWTKKNPSEWTEDEAIAWLFTAAKEGGVPLEVITATNNHPPLVDGGAQLARMGLSDYRQKYGPEYGVVFYRAFRQILTVHQHHQMLVNNGTSSQHQHHHQIMTGSNDLTNLQNFSTGMQQQHHYQQNNNGCSWSTTNMPTLEPDSYQQQQQQNNNNLIIPDQQQHHLVEMLNGYDTSASAGRQHHQQQQQQLFSGGMDCSNNHYSSAGQHQSAQMGNGLNYVQQHHQLNNNINAKYGADLIHQHHQHQQHQADGYYPNNCYSSLDGIIGGDHMEFPESYSNGTPSDPDEIGSTLNGSESGCNSINGGGATHHHLSASGNNSGGHGGSTTTKRVGRPSGTKSTNNINRRRKPADYADRGYGKLWEFIRDLLHNKLYCPTMIRWENVDEGVFRIVQSEKLAALWGELKHNPRMTYEKLSRAMRYYYKSKVFLPVLGRRLVYKFGPHAVDWKPENPNFERMDHHLHHIT